MHDGHDKGWCRVVCIASRNEVGLRLDVALLYSTRSNAIENYLFFLTKRNEYVMRLGISLMVIRVM